MPDTTTTLADLRTAVATFVAEPTGRSSIMPRIWRCRSASRPRSCPRSFSGTTRSRWLRPAAIAEPRERPRLELADILVY